MNYLDLALAKLGSPLILAFALGLFAALARSDLSIPEAAAKFLSIYLLFAIGFKGGVSVSLHGIDLALGTSLIAGIFLSAALPIIAFGMLRVMTKLDRTNAVAVARHYGSISIVTFVAATSVLENIRLDQAYLFTQSRFALMSAFASLMSFLIRAVRATFGGLPALIMA